MPAGQGSALREIRARGSTRWYDVYMPMDTCYAQLA